MKLSFSKHARVKIEERQITEELLRTVLENPEGRYYDTTSRAQAAVRRVSQRGVRLCLVVVFRRRDDVFHVVTAYPVKDLRGEMERKVKSGRWIPI